MSRRGRSRGKWEREKRKAEERLKPLEPKERAREDAWKRVLATPDQKEGE